VLQMALTVAACALMAIMPLAKIQVRLCFKVFMAVVFMLFVRSK
jgi:hypothetical protein